MRRILLAALLVTQVACIQNCAGAPPTASKSLPPPPPTPSGICTDDGKSAETKFHTMNSNQQGHYLVGPGLTGYSFNWAKNRGKSDTFTVAESLCSPDKSLTITADCSPTDKAGAYKSWMCTLISPAPVCKLDAGLDQPAAQAAEDNALPTRLMVIHGSFNHDGTFTEGKEGDNIYTLSCAVNWGKLRTASAAFKCTHGLFDLVDPQGDIYWKFVPGTKDFQTCVRAARADYCGDGVGHTEAGTRIDLYKADLSEPKRECDCGVCPEADWNEDGARCVQHVRWLDSEGASSVIGATTKTTCANDSWVDHCRSKNQIKPAVLYSRSKLHWRHSSTSQCDEDVPHAHSHHDGNSCAEDCAQGADQCDAGTCVEGH